MKKTEIIETINGIFEFEFECIAYDELSPSIVNHCKVYHYAKTDFFGSISVKGTLVYNGYLVKETYNDPSIKEYILTEIKRNLSNVIVSIDAERGTYKDYVEKMLNKPTT